MRWESSETDGTSDIIEGTWYLLILWPILSVHLCPHQFGAAVFCIIEPCPAAVMVSKFLKSSLFGDIPICFCHYYFNDYIYFLFLEQAEIQAMELKWFLLFFFAQS